MLTVTIQLKPKLKPNRKFSKITIILFGMDYTKNVLENKYV